MSKKLKRNIEGEIIGSWTIISLDQSRDYQSLFCKQRYLCKCECGTEKSLTGDHIQRMRSGRDSARCCKCGNESRRAKGKVTKTYISSLKGGARSRGISFEDITPAFLNELFVKQEKKCALSGVKIRLPELSGDHKNTTASLDRIDSKKGYCPKNVQWVHKIVNNMKWELPQQRFLYLCEAVEKGDRYGKID